jgi:hypothetical protein
MVVSAATRQAALIACVAAGLATGAAAQTASFKLTVSFSDGIYQGTAKVTSTPAGIDCRSESSGFTPNAGTCSVEFPAGTAVTLTATPLYGGTLDGWVGACAGQGATCQISMTETLTASPKTIAKTYTLTVRGGGNVGGGVRSLDPFARPAILCVVYGNETTSQKCAAEYPATKQAWIARDYDVSPVARFTWSGCDSAGPCFVIMDGPKTVTANWIAPEIVIRSAGGTGSGKVSGPDPIGTASPFDCTINFDNATGKCSSLWVTGPVPMTLTATPSPNSVFRGWYGGWCQGTGTCVFYPDRRTDRIQIHAMFDVVLYVLQVAPAGSGSGKIVMRPPEPECVITAGVASNTCSNRYPRGTPLTLAADPTGGSTFGGWGGACSGTQLTCTLVMNADTHATARFDPPRPAAELARALLGSLTITADEQYQLDRFGNHDGVFDLGDLVALLGRTGERLSPATMSALTRR